MTANVSVSNTTGLYIGSGASSVLNSAQQLLTILDNNGNVNFALDPTTSNTQVIAYFTGVVGTTYSNTQVAAFLPTYTGSLGNSSDIITLYANAATQATSINSINANLGAFETYANLTFGPGGPSSYGNANVAAYLPIYAGSLENSSSIINLWANAATQSVSIQTTNANLGAFETYANLTFGTSSYGNTQAAAWIKIDPTITGIQANLGAFEIYSNTSTQTTSANLGAYQIYANANAATQATGIQTISANLGAFEIYANATFGTSSYGNTQVAQYLPVYSGSMNSLNQITTSGTATLNGATLLNGGASVNGPFSITNAAGLTTIGNGGVNVGGNITTSSSGNVVVGSGGYYYGDGSKLTGLPATYGNAQVAQYLPVYAGAMTGLTNITASGTATLNGAAVFNNTATFNGQVSINNTAGVELIGTGGISSAGNITTNTAANVVVGAGGYYYGDGSKLTGITSSYGNTQVAAYLPTDATIIALQSNAAVQAVSIDTLTANAAVQSISIQNINANLGAYQSWANSSIQTTNANLGAFETYANLYIGANAYGNTQVAAFLPSYTGNLIPGNVSIPYTSGLRNRGPLAIGGTLNHYDTGIVASFQGNEPTYLYTSLQNSNSGATAYSSYALNDDSHTYYGELGINSSTYNYTTAGYPDNAFSKPYATFLQSTGANLAIGTYGNFGINFVVNGGTVAADAMAITNTGNVTMSGNAAVAGSVSAANLITTNGVFWSNGTAYSSYGNTQVAAYINNNGVAVGAPAVISSSNTADVNDAETGPVTGSFVFAGGGSIGKSVKIFGTGNIGNIISTGTTTLAAATISTTLGVTGNITAGNVAATYFVGDGSKLTNIATTYGNTQVAAYLPTYTGSLNGILTSGNVYAPNVTITNTGVSSASSVTIQGGNGNASVIGGNYLNLIGGNGVTINQQGGPVQIIGANLALYSNGYGGGLITTGNLITTNGVYWANGAVYSTGSSFTGNLAGSVLSDGVNQRILANAYPFSTPAATTNSNYVNFLQTAPVYTAGVLQAPASATTGIATTLITSANLGLQSSYQTSTNRTSISTINYAQITPVTANLMTLQDRVRGGASFTDVMLSGKTWGIMSTSSLFNTSVMGQINQLQLIGAGEVGPAYGMQGQVNVIPTSGSANVQYAAGVQSSVSYIAGAGATTSNIAYARLYTGQVSGANGTTLNITNAIGLHTPTGWAGSAVNKYTLLNEDTGSSITTLGNIYAQGNITTSGGWMLAGAAFTANSVSGATSFGTAAGAGTTTFLSPVTLSNTISGTGTISTSGNIGTTGNTILKGFTETVVAKGNSTGTVTIDANAGTVQTLTLTGSITINAANMTNFGLGRSVTLVLTQGGTGSYTLTSDMKFAGGNKTLSTAVGAIDVVNIFFDGTNYLAALVKGYA